MLHIFKQIGFPSTSGKDGQYIKLENGQLVFAPAGGGDGAPATGATGYIWNQQSLAQNASFWISGNQSTDGYAMFGRGTGVPGPGAGDGVVIGKDSSGKRYIQSYGTSPIYINPMNTQAVYVAAGGGSVAIGKATAPSASLDVAGDILAQKGSIVSQENLLDLKLNDGTSIFKVRTVNAGSLAEPTAVLKGNIVIGGSWPNSYPSMGQGDYNTIWNETYQQGLHIFKYGNSEQLNLNVNYPEAIIGYNHDGTNRNYGPGNAMLLRMKLDEGLKYQYNDTELIRFDTAGVIKMYGAVGSAGAINRLDLYGNIYGFGISGGALNYVTNQEHVFYVNTTKVFQILSDASIFAQGLNDTTGVAKMVVSTNGTLSLQAIPSGGGSVGTLQQVTDQGATTTNVVTVTNDLIVGNGGDGNGIKLKKSYGVGNMRVFDLTNTLNNNSVNFGAVGDGGDLRAHGINHYWLNPAGNTTYMSIVGGTVGITNLAGTGTRMVVADASGNLSTQAVPSGGGTLQQVTDLGATTTQTIRIDKTGGAAALRLHDASGASAQGTAINFTDSFSADPDRIISQITSSAYNTGGQVRFKVNSPSNGGLTDFMWAGEDARVRYGKGIFLPVSDASGNASISIDDGNVIMGTTAGGGQYIGATGDAFIMTKSSNKLYLANAGSVGLFVSGGTITAPNKLYVGTFSDFNGAGGVQVGNDLHITTDGGYGNFRTWNGSRFQSRDAATTSVIIAGSANIGASLVTYSEHSTHSLRANMFDAADHADDWLITSRGVMQLGKRSEDTPYDVGNSAMYYNKDTHQFRGLRNNVWKNFLMEGDVTASGGTVGTLQQVTDAGNTTTNSISARGITSTSSGNAYLGVLRPNDQQIAEVIYQTNFSGNEWHVGLMNGSFDYSINYNSTPIAKFTTGGTLNLGSITSPGDYRLLVGGSAYVSGKLAITASGTISGAYYSDEALIFTHNGNIGQSANMALMGGTAGRAQILFGDTDAPFNGRVVYNLATDSMQLWTNNVERVNISSAGNVEVRESLLVSGTTTTTNLDGTNLLGDMKLSGSTGKISGDYATAKPTPTYNFALTGTYAGYGGTLTPGTTYYFAIYGVDAQGEHMQPSPELAVTLDAGKDEIDLEWTAVAGASFYHIFAGTAAGVYTRFWEVGPTDLYAYVYDYTGAAGNDRLEAQSGTYYGTTSTKPTISNLIYPFAIANTGATLANLHLTDLAGVGRRGLAIDVTGKVVAASGSGDYINNGGETKLLDHTLINGIDSETLPNSKDFTVYARNVQLAANTDWGIGAGNYSISGRNGQYVDIGSGSGSNTTTFYEEKTFMSFGNEGFEMRLKAGNPIWKIDNMGNSTTGSTRFIVQDIADNRIYYKTVDQIKTDLGVTTTTDTNFGNTNITATGSRTHTFGANTLTLNFANNGQSNLQMYDTRFNSEIIRTDVDRYSSVFHTGSVAKFGIESYNDLTAYNRIDIDDQGMTLKVSPSLGAAILNLYGNTVNVGVTGGVVNLSGVAKTPNDVEITDSTKGVIMKSPDGSRWRLTIDDDGAIITTKL